MTTNRAGYMREYYAANRDRLKAQQAEYRAAHKAERKVSNATHYAANREQRKAAQRAYNASRTPTEKQREEARERTRKWTAAHPEVPVAYYKANRERLLAQHAEWREANRERFRGLVNQGVQRRRARLKGLVAERFDRAEIFERDNWACQLCGKAIEPELAFPDPASASIDHVVPIAKGGDHVRGNVQAAHLGCNSSKGARLPDPGAPQAVLVH